MPLRPVLGLALAAPAIVPAVAAPSTFFDGLRYRPTFMLDPPEPIAVLAAVPEGAPMQMTWRRVRRRIVRAEGPERIAPAWWESLSPRTSRPKIPAWSRDYYLVEEMAGARYWVFRAGLYAREAEDETIEGIEQERTPRWFMHGVLP
jgi:protein ImuB